ncbi:MAG: hypothetical protein Q9195_007833 [Heterodermia aff. obscurata]
MRASTTIQITTITRLSFSITVRDRFENSGNNSAAPSTIVVCSSRETFLESINLSIRGSSDDNIPNSTEEDVSRPQHALLLPTIHLLAKSRAIDLAFTPTLQHLRAYLATQDAPSVEIRGIEAQGMSSLHFPVLAIFGLLGLHRSTGEFSAQGLSRTLSIAVEASIALGRKLVIADIPPDIEEKDAIATDEVENEVQPDPWMEQIPILNGSIRSGDEERVWAGRTVEVARVHSEMVEIILLISNGWTI